MTGYDDLPYLIISLKLLACCMLMHTCTNKKVTGTITKIKMLSGWRIELAHVYKDFITQCCQGFEKNLDPYGVTSRLLNKFKQF